MKNFDGDLMAYLVLSELSKDENNFMSREDIVSKMTVHSRKLRNSNLSIKFK